MMHEELRTRGLPEWCSGVCISTLTPFQVLVWDMLVPRHCWLRPFEEELLARKVSAAAQLDWIAGRLAAKRALVRALVMAGVPPESLPYQDLEIGNTQFGVPYLRSDLHPIGRHPLALRLSISHSHGYGSAVVSLSKAVGIDVEIERPGIRSFGSRFLAPSEKSIIFGYPVQDQGREMTMRWTLKEATLKALGCGLRVSVRHVETIYRPEDRDYNVCVHPDSECRGPGQLAAGKAFVFPFEDSWQSVAVLD